MPKIVDHDVRRRELVAATWRIIARGGFAAATLNSVESEAGFSHGIVRHYFSSKEDLLAQAFREAYEHTVDRAVKAIDGGTGLEALRKLCLELLPLDVERRLEAQVVVAFWDYAAFNPQLTTVHAEAVQTWRRLFLEYLTDAQRAGEVDAAAPIGTVADQLLLLVNGAQVVPLLIPEQADSGRQVAVLDYVIAGIRARPALR
ncbi:MAG: TetR/AcrR family transcriptional regulator [Trebonia sp.]